MLYQKKYKLGRISTKQDEFETLLKELYIRHEMRQDKNEHDNECKA